MVKPIYTDIEYEQHKQYMRDRYHRIEFNMKNNIKQPPIITIIKNPIVLEFI
jgi:hypothetical protein